MKNEATQLREIAGLTVQQLASLLGVSRQSYYKWLSDGLITPEHTMLLKEMIVTYRMKGWLQSVEPLAWGVPRLTSAEQEDALDHLSPRPIREETIVVEEDEGEAYFAVGFVF